MGQYNMKAALEAFVMASSSVPCGEIQWAYSWLPHREVLRQRLFHTHSPSADTGRALACTWRQREQCLWQRKGPATFPKNCHDRGTSGQRRSADPLGRSFPLMPSSCALIWRSHETEEKEEIKKGTLSILNLPPITGVWGRWVENDWVWRGIKVLI